MHEVAPGIRSWNQWSERLGYRLNGFYWREGPDAVAVAVDPPELTEAARDHMEAEGRPSLIVVTNRTHWRGSSEVREWSGARVAMSAADAVEVDPPVDRILVPDEMLPGGWRVLDMAGKTRGELGLYRATLGGVLLVGDTLIGDPPGELRLLPAEKIDDRALLLASLGRIAPLEYAILLVGDGEPIRRDAAERVRAFVREIGE